MEGIDEMWMRSEPCWPKAVLYVRLRAQGEERALMRAPAVHRRVATRYPSCGRPRALVSFLWITGVVQAPLSDNYRRDTTLEARPHTPLSP